MDKQDFQSRLEQLRTSANRASLISLLNDLPSAEEYEFEIYLEQIVEEAPSCSDELKEILRSDQYPTSVDEQAVRFSAFFGLSLSYLRRTELTALNRHLQDYSEAFGDYPLFLYLRSRYLRKRGKPTSIEEAVEVSRSAKASLPNHAGVAHNFAQALVLAVEDGYVDGDQDELTSAREDVQSAIDNNPQRAEFYGTKGRLIALIDEDYDRARQLIREAMDREDANRPDYPLLIGEYQFHLSKIDIRRYESRLNQRLSKSLNQIQTTEEKTRERIEAYQSRTLQSLGFFAAILGVIVTSTQVIIGIGLPDAMRLILVLNGSILIIFAGFTAMLPQEELPMGRILLATILGVLLAGSGTALVYL